MRPDEPLDPPLQTIEVGGTTLAYTESGSGRPIVAIHGLPSSSWVFRWLDSAFDGRARFLRLDLPGFGESGIEAPESASFATMAEAVRAFLEAKELEGAVLLGHSAGGPIALEAALDNERVAGVVLLNSNGKFMHKGNFPRSYRMMVAIADANSLTRRVILGIAKPFSRRMGMSKRLSDDQLVLAARINGHYDPERFGGHIARYASPVLVVWATGDPMVQTAITEATLTDAKQPTELQIEAKTHNLQATHPVEVVEGVVSWIETHLEG